MRSVAAALLLFFALPTAHAQSTNLALFQELALECLGELPEADTLILEAPDRMPYVRSALIEAWQSDGVDVFLADDTRSGTRLTYDVEDAIVVYERGGGGISRHVKLNLRYTLAALDGRVVADDRCTGRRSDRITADQIAEIEADAYSETQGDLPQGGWFRRVLEPAVITAASAVAVYLFFVLRTANGDDT